MFEEKIIVIVITIQAFFVENISFLYNDAVNLFRINIKVAVHFLVCIELHLVVVRRMIICISFIYLYFKQNKTREYNSSNI